jgi:hypothetical protein
LVREHRPWSHRVTGAGCLTGAGVWGLAAHQQWPLAVRGLHGLTFGYGAVLVYHLVLCVRLV